MCPDKGRAGTLSAGIRVGLSCQLGRSKKVVAGDCAPDSAHWQLLLFAEAAHEAAHHTPDEL